MEIQADIVREIVKGKLATKQDLISEIATIRQEMKELELRLTTRFGAMLAAAVAIIAALNAFMK